MSSETPRRLSPALAVALVVLLLAGVATGLYLLLHRPAAGPDLPRLGAAPAFTLVSESGTAVTTADYRGTVWIADFIFTRCGGSCPILSSRMLALSKKTADVPAIRYVSFGVDPEYDTPEVLAAYARDLGADLSRWRFLHGERPVIRSLIKDGFKLAIEDGPAESVEPILHSTRFVLVDGEGTIRGYYDGMEQPPVDVLEKDARALAAALRERR
ncbi:MAG: SCO family protein [Thermoanaerobaculia bacterium]|nr:SCO family protein [Thermoanaerobaculia bacterium]